MTHEYGWAENDLKLSLAVADVKAEGKEPTEALVKEAYIKRGGLVKEKSGVESAEQAPRRGRKAKDESAEEGADEE